METLTTVMGVCCHCVVILCPRCLIFFIAIHENFYPRWWKTFIAIKKNFHRDEKIRLCNLSVFLDTMYWQMGG